MTEQEIVTTLNRLADVRARKQALADSKQRKIDKIMLPFKAELDRLEKGYKNDLKPLDLKDKELEAKVKGAVVELGETVRGDEGDPALMAVFMSARVTWNSDMLTGMMEALPGIKKAREIGEPNCTIRKIG